MAVALRDENNVETLLAASSADGSTPINVLVNPSTHALFAVNGTTGSDLGGTTAARDVNRVPVVMATSNADGTTPTEVYCGTDGRLLIKFS